MSENKSRSDIDRKSFELGIIAAFAEVVSLGVKKLALSSPLAPALYEELSPEAQKITERNTIKSFLEKDFLVTDLFPPDIARDMYVILLYRDVEVIQSYLALKEKKSALVEANSYAGAARAEIAREFGRLLSYPEKKIEELLS